MPTIESLIGDRFNRLYAFGLGMAGLLATIVTVLQKFESQWWLPALLGGLSFVLLAVAAFARPRK